MTPNDNEHLTDFALPPLPAIPSKVELGAPIREAFEALCQELYRQADVHAQRWAAQNSKYPQANFPQPMTPQEIETAYRFLESGAGGAPHEFPTIPSQYGWSHEDNAPLQHFLRQPQLPPVAMLRALIFTHYGRPPRDQFPWLFLHKFEELIRDYWKHHDVGFPLGLRELAGVFSAAGIPPETIGRCRLLTGYWQISFLWDAEATWPYFAEHQHLLAEALELEPHIVFQPRIFLHPPNLVQEDWAWRYRRADRRKSAFDLLAMFPSLPERFVEPCWEVALSLVKTERLWAQKALARIPDRLERILAALKNGKQEMRTSAAEWLSRLGDHCAIEPLKQALAKEKHDVPKGAALTALERLGVPIDEFLDRPGLMGEAEKGLAKGVPDDLAWFPFQQLPAVHWQDKAKRIPPDVLKWWIVQGHKLKKPEPGVILRRYAQLMRPAEAAELGLFVLSAWIAFDTRMSDEAETAQRAQSHYQKWGGYGMTYQQALQIVQKEPIGSAVAQKGILAVAGACCDGRAATMVGAYLKQWYGLRAAQCKALIQMVAWIDHSAAIQLLLATARRFRTAGIRKEAEKCVKQLAERRDWTVAELADRSISTCGLDENRQILFDYGPRRFFAQLDDELSFALIDSEGKTIAALPEPRKDEDAELVKQIKKNYSAAKKELKTIVKQQQERFYEAMCEQREWLVADWDVFLRQHPVVGRLCQRVIWAQVKEDKVIRTFRPLADGTLTGPEDTQVEIDPVGRIRVAHDLMVTPEEALRWKNHLADYEVVPLFEQVGKPIYHLPDGAKEQTEIRDFVGHMIEAFKLRGRATKLGYVRGGAEDGGWFYRYQKQFPTLGIEASIEFSGNGLPEENRTVALMGLSFQRTLSDEEVQFGGSGRSHVLLSEVPAVLLSECWNDMKSISAQGTGFDPDWEKKVHQ
jgi:Domain of unknown function (DUF4132)